MGNSLLDNTFYNWLNNNPSIYSWKDFNKYIQHIKNYNLTSNEQILLINCIVPYLNVLSELLIEQLPDSYKDVHFKELIKPVINENRQASSLLLNYYLTCIHMDLNKKSCLWNSDTLPIIEHLPLGESFLQQYCPDFFTKSIYRKKAHKYTIDYCVKNEIAFLCSSELKKHIEHYSNKIQTYNKKTDWNSILKNKPSFVLSLIAQKQGYQLNDPQVFNIFHNLYQIVQSSSFDKEKIESLATLFCEFFCETPIFKNTLSHTNQIHNQIAKFFHIVYKEDSYRKNEQFANFIISFKGFDKDSLAKKLEKLQHFNIMGKYYLNSNEKTKFDELKNKDKPTKKIKI